MSALIIALVVFGCVFGGALLGVFLRSRLPHHHMSAESKDAIKVGMGLVGTMAALVLGLLVASAKSSYDAQSAELTQMAATAVLLDRALAVYGPETKEARDLLHRMTARMLEETWSRDGGGTRSGRRSESGENLFAIVQGLSPKNDLQRSLQSQALGMMVEIAKTRWLMYEQSTTSISMPMLVLLVLWLSTIFISFGLFAPSNVTVITSFFVSALSVSGAIYLIMEMYAPYTGLIRISSAPLRAALAQLGH